MLDLSELEAAVELGKSGTPSLVPLNQLIEDLDQPRKTFHP